MQMIVTGGAGFIGSALCRHLIGATPWSVVNVDKLTYAANLDSLSPIVGHERYRFVQGDIADARLLRALFQEVRPDAVINLAAESHVDRSIDAAADFIHTNIDGTFVLLEEARRYCDGLAPERARAFRFHHVSTDEVYGALGPSGKFTETTAYDPSSPYAASKAASDHLVRAWGRTYGLPVLITNCSNNYGPYQFPEKLVPLMILRGLKGETLPVYGEGENIRDWLYVEDHAEALITVLTRGRAGIDLQYRRRRGAAEHRHGGGDLRPARRAGGAARLGHAARARHVSSRTGRVMTRAMPSTRRGCRASSAGSRPMILPRVCAGRCNGISTMKLGGGRFLRAATRSAAAVCARRLRRAWPSLSGLRGRRRCGLREAGRRALRSRSSRREATK